MIYRVTLGFAGQNQGWQEVHAVKSALTNPNDLVPQCQEVAQKRANFLGSPFSIVGFRIAKFSNDAGTTREKGSFFLRQSFTAANPSLTGPAEPGNVAIIQKSVANTTDPALAPFAGRTAVSWLGAPPDGAVTSGGLIDLGANGLGAALTTYWQAISSTYQWGWLAAVRNDDVKIVTADQNGDGTVTVLLQRNVNPAPVLFLLRNVRMRGINGGRSPLNGSQLGYFNALNQFTTQDVIGIPTQQIGGNMRVYNPIPTFLPYGSFQLNGITGEHKRGRPFGTSPGRQRKRVRG